METADVNEPTSIPHVATAQRRVPLAWLVPVAVLIGLGAYWYQHRLNGYVHNVRIANLVLDGVTLSVAHDMLRAHTSSLSTRPLTLQFIDETGRQVYARTVTLVDIGITFDADATWQNVVRRSSRWSSVPNLLLRKIVARPLIKVPLTFSIDSATSERFWRQIRQVVERSPRDARLSISSDGTRQVLPEQAGLKLPAKPEVHVIEALQELRSTVSIPLQTVQPRITSAHLQTIDAQLSAAVTRFSEAQRNRSHNIRQATARINGIVLLPGDVFSYNETVGPRTIRDGFRKAPVIVKGELVPGDGGGVCQVSSTLYMAALQAGLEIVQRSKHAFPIGYAPAGLDATVVYGVLDLRFRNNTPYPIAINAHAQRGRMMVQVWGSNAVKRRVRIQRVVHSVVPAPVKTLEAATLPEGVTRTVTKGHAGMRVSVYRIIEQPGKPPVREKVSADFYRPQTRVVMVGKAPRPENKSNVPLVGGTPSIEEEPLLQP